MAQLTSNRFSLPTITPNKSPQTKVSVGRTMRPSLFLNQIDILPTSLKTEGEVTERNTSKPLYTQIDSEPTIAIPYHFRLPQLATGRGHKYQQSLPEIPLLPHDPNNASPLDFERLSKRRKVILQRMDSKQLIPVAKFQRKRVEFRKSIIVIDIDTGVQDKQQVTEERKPLRRIAHQKTRSFAPLND